MMHGSSQFSLAVGDKVQEDRQPWSILILLCIAQFMVIIDMTVVNIALPSIGQALKFSTAAALQWIVTIYVLFSGGLQMLGGRTADLLGRRRMFLLGLLVFTAASLASGFATSPLFLIISRAFQGLGAAILTPSALSIITSAYTGKQRATALATWGALGAAGAAVGVLLGGILTSSLGWPAIFFINVPIGVVTLALALHAVPVTPRVANEKQRPDIAGGFTAVAAPTVLVFAISSAATSGWISLPVMVALAVAAVLIGAFVLVERRARQPIIPPAIWGTRSLVSSSVIMLGATAIMAGAFLLNSLYLQRVLGLSALAAGLSFLPFAISSALGAHIGSRLLGHAGTKALAILGLVAAGIGVLLWARIPAHPSYVADLLPGFVLVGLGIGWVFVSVSVAAMSDIKQELAGVASGVMMSSHELGAAFGVAVLSGILTTAMGTETTVTSLANGYRASMVAAAILAALMITLALFVLPSVRPAGGTKFRIH